MNATAINLWNDYGYGRGEIFDTYPCVFPTVWFELEDSMELNHLADEERSKRLPDELPIYPKQKGDPYDLDGWFEFTLGFYRIGGNVQADSSISVTVHSSNAPDSGESYNLDLDEKDRARMYGILNHQCIRIHRKGILDMLNEAEQLIKEGKL